MADITFSNRKGQRHISAVIADTVNRYRMLPGIDAVFIPDKFIIPAFFNVICFKLDIYLRMLRLAVIYQRSRIHRRRNNIIQQVFCDPERLFQASVKITDSGYDNFCRLVHRRIALIFNGIVISFPQRVRRLGIRFERKRRFRLTCGFIRIKRIRIFNSRHLDGTVVQVPFYNRKMKFQRPAFAISVWIRRHRNRTAGRPQQLVAAISNFIPPYFRGVHFNDFTVCTLVRQLDIRLNLFSGILFFFGILCRNIG